MGYMRHNAIVVTSWKEEAIKEAAAMAEKIGLLVIRQSEEAVNGYRSLLVCPDGSKEGWDESDRGDERREGFNAKVLKSGLMTKDMRMAAVLLSGLKSPTEATMRLRKLLPMRG